MIIIAEVRYAQIAQMDGYILMYVNIGKGEGCGTVNSKCTLNSEGMWQLDKCGHAWPQEMSATKEACPKCTMTFNVWGNTYTALKEITWTKWIEGEGSFLRVNGEYIDERSS